MDDQKSSTLAATSESPALGSAGKQFTIVRVFDAPRATIWNAWTDPAQAPIWWHPRGVTTPAESVRLDPRVGGSYSYTMIVDADGSEYPTAGVYREISEPERLVFSWGAPGDDDSERPVITIELRERGEQTEMTFTVAGIDGTPGDENVYDGWAGAFDVLVDALA